MRLIDTDKLLDDMKKELEKAVNDENLDKDECMVILTSAIALKDFVDRQPTAFDVDKIKKELRSLKQYDNKYDSYYDHTMYMMTDLQNKIVNRTIDKVLEIVKRGGIDD